jgi:hypothetical protein
MTVLFGTSEELTRYRNEIHPERASLAPVDKGQADLENRVIYVANEAGETVLHECLRSAPVGQK